MAIRFRPTSSQAAVLRGMSAALLLTLLAYAVSLLVLPAYFPAADVHTTLRYLLLLPLPLLWSIAALARHRFFTPDDIDGSGLSTGTAKARLLQSILQNTLEQTVLCFIVNLAWIANAPGSLVLASPVNILLFLAGRLLFTRAYAAGAGARAFGFALSFYPSALMAIAGVFLVVNAMR